jgi:hypothetical protein
LVLSSSRAAEISGVRVRLQEKMSAPMVSECSMELIYTSEFTRNRTECKTGANFTIVYLAKPKILRQIFDQKKTYADVEEKDLKKLWLSQKDLDVARARYMKKRINSLSHMREMARRLTQRSIDKTPIVFKKTSRKEKVKSWSCEVFERWQGKEKLSEICFAPWKSLGIDITPMKSAIKDSRDFREMYYAALPSGPLPQENGLDRVEGLILKENVSSSGQPIEEITVTEIKVEKIPSEPMSAPPGFTLDKDYLKRLIQ